jgi:hypothetical protein
MVQWLALLLGRLGRATVVKVVCWLLLAAGVEEA